MDRPDDTPLRVFEMRARPFREFFEIASSTEEIVFAFEISLLFLNTAREQTTSFGCLYKMPFGAAPLCLQQTLADTMQKRATTALPTASF
ncbi:MAG: hypothetical protein LAN36_12205 [Acidobacteriia bacterium]|nr:hypothetical protein [Terriglobia bacterium]